MPSVLAFCLVFASMICVYLIVLTFYFVLKILTLIVFFVCVFLFRFQIL